jgi:F-type H+-transporting ATPase subunit b
VFLATNFLVPNATFVVELIAFLAVLGVLARYVLPPLNKAIETRQETIRQSLDAAEASKRAAAEAESKEKETLEEARAQARAILEEANRASEALKATRREEAEQEYQRRLAAVQPEIDASTRRAAEEVRRDVSALVMAVVEKVIGRSFDDEAHRQLIDRTIVEVEASSTPAPQVNA